MCCNHDCLDCYPKQDEMIDSYVVRWKLRNEAGHEWIEEFETMSLSDFEVVYGSNIHQIVWCTFRMENESIL